MNTLNLAAVALAALVGYLLGSISFSIVYSRLFRHASESAIRPLGYS